MCGSTGWFEIGALDNTRPWGYFQNKTDMLTVVFVSCAYYN